MKKPVKAAVISAVIYPGLGHIFLEKKRQGFMWATVFTVPLYLLVSELLTQTKLITKQVIEGTIPLDISAISQAVFDAMATKPALTYCTYLLAILWLLAIADSFRLGCKAV